MITKTLLFTGLIFSITSYAQVGVNTNTPTRSLDINGHLKIRETVDESENGEYSKILVTDNDGNIDFIYKKDLLPVSDEFTSDKVVINNIYMNTTSAGIPSKKITCGKFEFSFNGDSNSKIQFNLVQAPTQNVSIYMSMEQNYDPNGFQFYQGTSKSNINPFIFTTSNWSTAQPFAEAGLADFEQNIMYFQYPNDPDFYRLTVYKVKHTINNGSTWSFVSACEKF
ncbi:hypothetical protein SAMN05421738_11040 [Algoriella xinjiangensis]|uniref:Uncharacterized protein n=1 Tax=Algoriella xinjiangensis TaxID=684065 RepID=A0A1I4XZQ3_9FLAO|nr:hypothetical protein [Algoriella xinjiangensis]SFN31236.1 hypothetical protein SAMN05421738_11040 [Algoriella xinjiangensis]VDH15370.1 Uncharacterised protein [Algoriella xinjiangensis]